MYLLWFVIKQLEANFFHSLVQLFSSVFNKDERGDTIPDKGPSPHCDMPAICVGVEGGL